MRISTTELGRRLGIPLPSSEIARISGIQPERLSSGSGGVYWDEEDIPAIAAALGAHFLRIAAAGARRRAQLQAEFSADAQKKAAILSAMRPPFR